MTLQLLFNGIHEKLDKLQFKVYALITEVREVKREKSTILPWQSLSLQK